METKKCSKCRIEKLSSMFYKDKRATDGLFSCCKRCHLNGSNKQYKKEYNKKYRKENKERIKKQRKEYRKKNREKMSEQTKEWKKKNKGRLKEYYKKRNQKHYKDNKQKVLKYNRIWRKKNKEKMKKYNIKYRKRKSEDVKFRIDTNISNYIRYALKGKKAGRKWETLVGYTVEDLMKHLESKFEMWMSWKNHGKINKDKQTWNIDHIKPKTLFKYKTAECKEFKKCWALENLQPLDAIENIRKSNKII